MFSKRGRVEVGPGTKLTSGPGEWVMVAGTSWWYRWRDKDCFPGGHSWYIKCYNAQQLRSYGNFHSLYIRRAKVTVFLPVAGFLFVPFQGKQ